MAEWGKLYGSLNDDPKWLNATKGARALWTTALSWCIAHHKSNGHVPKAMLTSLQGHPKEASCLVRVGLWDEDGLGGWVFHDWADYQRTSDQVSARIEAGKAGAAARWNGTNRNASGNANRMRSAMQSREEESREEETPDGVSPAAARASSRRKPERAIPQDWEPTDKHEAQAQGLGVDIDREAFRFRNHAQANDRRARDWDAAFRNWLDHAKPTPQAQRQPTPAAAAETRSIWDILPSVAELRARDEAARRAADQ